METHPYGIFIPRNPKAMLIGSFPIAKFTNRNASNPILPHEIDFSYGGGRNQLWPLLSICFKVELKTKNQILRFLEKKGIAMGDVIRSCTRINGGSSDSDLRDIVFYHEVKDEILRHSIKKIFFTSTKVQAWFHSKIGGIGDVHETVLMSCSASGLRSIPNHLKEEHRKWKIDHPHQRTTDFRIHLYRKIFNERTFPDLE